MRNARIGEMDSFQLLVDGLPKVMAATEMSKVPKIAIEQMMAVSVGAPFSSPVWSENEDVRQRRKTLKGGQSVSQSVDGLRHFLKHVLI